MRRAVAAAGWMVLVASCEQPRTELVARVDSEVAWGAGRTVQSVTLTVRRGGPTGPLRSARTTALGVGGERRPLPLLVGIVPTDDTDTPVWIEALGCRDPNGCAAATAVVAQRAVVRFTLGQTEEVTLLLASACVGVTCGSDERCGTTGRCEPATRATVRPFNGTDAGTMADVASDAGGMDRPMIADAPMTDSGSPPDRNDLGVVVDAVVPVDAPAPDVLAVDTGAVPDTAASCGALEIRCGGVCVAALRDPMNCGDCGAVCPAVASATATCMGGRCGFACDATHADCDERPSNGCETDLTTNHYSCGACGRMCGDTEQCMGGTCVPCAAGLEWCAGQCMSYVGNNAHCGNCGSYCPDGYQCTVAHCALLECDAGVIADAAGPAMGVTCSGVCTDVAHDARHCGRCTTMCTSSRPYCENGVCRECPFVSGQPQALCGGVCIDVAFDRMNCGACGNVCPPGFRCSSGLCHMG